MPILHVHSYSPHVQIQEEEAPLASESIPEPVDPTEKLIHVIVMNDFLPTVNTDILGFLTKLGTGGLIYIIVALPLSSVPYVLVLRKH